MFFFRPNLKPLLICDGYRSCHVHGGRHRPAKTKGGIATLLVPTGNVTVSDVRVADGTCAELEGDDVGRQVSIAMFSLMRMLILRWNALALRTAWREHDAREWMIPISEVRLC